ncbi:23S rRNA (adenine(2503)-C(2))-methyltransferase RlmN [Schnuerera sp. xch1]|nr:23S rRNA (adenine(2503)-C(2))-methyltransferase RlmN [Schnuerera sp. xch1]
MELNSLTFDELQDFITTIDEKKYRAEQLYSFIHKNYGKEIEDITVFSKDLRDKLNRIGKLNNIEIFKRFDSKVDDTKKYLFLLEDDNIIEGVAMDYKHGLTACISTQVGCRMGCSFCASTKEGLIRMLNPSEMANQIYAMEEDLDKQISNIVLMGSGEPLDNYDNTIKFLDIIHHKKGHNISYRNITLSTCGLVPKIYELADEQIPITLSISLHSPFDEIRKTMIPIAKKYSIEEIMNACKYYYNKTNRRITMEYTLVKGVNDRKQDLKQLKTILKGLNCHVNLIPLNPIEEFKEQRPSKKSIERFKTALSIANIPATVRKEMGGDINASCGQLRRRFTNKSKNFFQ